MPGGLSGESKSEQQMPPWLAEASQDAIAQANEIGQIGYVPNYGPDVAAFNPMQQAAMQNTANMAGSYGMAVPQMDIPAPQTFAGGVQGYSSAPLYEESVAALQANRPGQYDAIMSQFIDPFTGDPYGTNGAGAPGFSPFYQPTPMSSMFEDMGFTGFGEGNYPGAVMDPMGNLVNPVSGLPIHPGGRGR